VQGLKNRRLPVQYSPIPAKSNICNLEISFFLENFATKICKKITPFFYDFWSLGLERIRNKSAFTCQKNEESKMEGKEIRK
jgi:hypothetical protein